MGAAGSEGPGGAGAGKAPPRDPSPGSSVRLVDPPPPGPPRDGRLRQSVLVARAEPLDETGRVALRSPRVGWLREAPFPGDLIDPGAPVGRLEVLGTLHRLVAPAGARGLVVALDGDDDAAAGGRARRPVSWDEAFLLLDPGAAGQVAERAAEQAAGGTGATGGLVFRSPSSGRFYARPSPDDPPYLAPGDEVTTGQTIGLLEVMKTFSRLTYGGPGLPPRARVLRVVPADESDVDQGAPVLELEAL